MYSKHLLILKTWRASHRICDITNHLVHPANLSTTTQVFHSKFKCHLFKNFYSNSSDFLFSHPCIKRYPINSYTSFSEIRATEPEPFMDCPLNTLSDLTERLWIRRCPALGLEITTTITINSCLIRPITTLLCDFCSLNVQHFVYCSNRRFSETTIQERRYN